MKNVSRRTVVKGAAWSVPVVAATVAVPAYAASGAAKVVVTEITLDSATLRRGQSFNTHVCIQNQGTENAPAAQNVVWVDYYKDTIDTTKVKLATAGWTVGAPELTSNNRLQIPLTYGSDLAPNESACADLGNLVQWCPTEGGTYANATLYGYGSSSKAFAYDVAPSPSQPTLYPVGVTDSPNNQKAESEQGSVRQGGEFALFYQAFNPGTTAWSGVQDFYVGIPTAFGDPVDVRLDQGAGFTLSYFGKGGDMPGWDPGYAVYKLTYTGTLQPACSTKDAAAEAWLRVRVPAGTGIHNYQILSRVYGAPGTAVDRYSWVQVYPPA